MADRAVGSWLERLFQSVENFNGVILPALAFVMIVFLTSRLLRGRQSRTATRSILGRIGDAVVRAFTTNWQLTLLATTAFVLSCASGWTTWDGMRNFTGEPILSFMVTFGIQGVMLIIAWLIGESFAAGMNQRRGADKSRSGGSRIEPVVGLVVGTLFALSLFIAVATALGVIRPSDMTASGASLSRYADGLIYLSVGLLLIATLLSNSKSDIAQPYVQSARIIARNAVLWLMFLACMATSVFFSFDSLFSSIFPQDERRRAADIRAVNQVAGVVADVGTLIQRRQIEEADRLFQTEGWKAYERNLAELSRQSQGAEAEIERYFVQLMEARRRAIAEQQERIASAQSAQAGLAPKKATLTDELSRLKGERPALAADLAEKRTERENRSMAVDAKRVEAMAEERGAEGTLKVGKGPQYRERMAELARMQDALKIQEERVRDAEKRIAAVDTRIAQIERELAAIDAEIAKLKGEAQTAENRIKVAEQVKEADEGPKVDPARVRMVFERARAEFRQEPTVERLNALATQCTQLTTALAATPATKERVRNIDCDPKQANEAAARVFALNAGLESFARNCAGGDKLPQSGGVDAMLGFGRKCLQDSGLPSKDSGELAAKLSAIDLNRDDKAHRFVVTWNAFQDGNRLAYLALAIAIAIDSLVFMSGLFGATAVRSPLTDLEGRSDLTAEQLEGAIDATLNTTPHPRQTLAALLRSMHPVAADDGFTSEIILDDRDPLADEMRAVLVAGATIGAVRRVGSDRSRYLVSTGLARYFAVAQRKSWKVDTAEAERRELVSVIGVALRPDVVGNAELVLSELHPVSDADGYSAEVNPYSITDEEKRRLVMNVLGAGATVKGAVYRPHKEQRYFVSSDFYKALLLMRAPPIRPYRDGGDGTMRSAHRLITDDVKQIGSDRHVLPSPDVRSPDARADEGRETAARKDAHRAGPPPLPPTAGEEAQGESTMPRVARSELQRSKGSDEMATSLGSRIRAELIELGGLHPWNDREIALAAQIGENSEAEQALRRLSGRAPHLAKLVADAIDDYRGSVQDAFEMLKAHHVHEKVYLDVLETEAGKLMHLMPLLILSPRGPYQQILERIVYDLEPQEAEGALSPADRAIFLQAKSQIAQLNALADNQPDRLHRVARIIEQCDERQSPPAGSWAPEDGENRTLN